MTRTNLKVLRVKNNLTQQEMAEKIGITRATYCDIENGKRAGAKRFWNSVQAAFDVPSEKMWELMDIDQD